MTAGEDDPAALAAATRIAADSAGEVVGLTIGDGDASWALARGVDRSAGHVRSDRRCWPAGIAPTDRRIGVRIRGRLATGPRPSRLMSDDRAATRRWRVRGPAATGQRLDSVVSPLPKPRHRFNLDFLISAIR
jgi:hypothetical protein